MAKGKKKDETKPVEEVDKPKCGLIMPIASSADYSSDHWSEVKGIITEALDETFDVDLVSDQDDAGVIHARIVQNLYENPIVVCDVSSLNPNCMFELGLRLAFDMPTVIIKDDKTDYRFDTNPIEHVGYRKDLRFRSVNDFQDRLRDKVQATYEKRKEDPESSVFLKHFVRYEAKKLGTIEADVGEMILKRLSRIENRVQDSNQVRTTNWAPSYKTVIQKRDLFDQSSQLLVIPSSNVIIGVIQDFQEIGIVEQAYEGPLNGIVVHTDCNERDLQKFVGTIEKRGGTVSGFVG